MTVSTTTNKISYTGNGVAVEFAIPFPFLDASHLKAYQLLNNIRTQRTDWEIQSGNLIFETAPVSGAKILIIREIPLTQETDYRENEILPAETLERNFDRLTMQIQQLEEKTQRAVTVDVFDDTDSDNLIPFIRQAVSDCAEFSAAINEKSKIIENHAKTTEEQAVLATQKAAEAAAVLSETAQKDLSNCTRPYVIEQNNTDGCWYRIWNNGWKECGGLAVCASNINSAQFNFPVVFVSIPLVFCGLSAGNAAFTYNHQPTNTSVVVGAGIWLYEGTLNAAGSNGCQISVYACGY